jgi:DnaJ-class molecular chaperone
MLSTLLKKMNAAFEKWTKPTCPDCWGEGRRIARDAHGVFLTVCRLCRGTGRIEDDTKGERP